MSNTLIRLGLSAIATLTFGLFVSCGTSTTNASHATDGIPNGENALVRTQSVDRSSYLSDLADEVIYLALIDRFADGSMANNTTKTDKSKIGWYYGGDLVGLTNNLDYIKALGATTLLITPVYEQSPQLTNDTYGFHGYWFNDVSNSRIDPQFGTKAEFEKLITEAHAKGLKVILDVVVNHAGYEASIWKDPTKTSWFHDDADCKAAPAIEKDEKCPLYELPDFDQDDVDTADYLKKYAVKYWINEYKIDGIRVDAVKHVPKWFLQDLISEVQSGVGMAGGIGRPDIIWMGEDLMDTDRDHVGSFQKIGFDGMFDFPLRNDMVNTFANGGSVKTLSDAINLYEKYYPNPALMSTLLGNHDKARFTSLVGYPGFVWSDDEVRSRQMLAFAYTFTMRGIPHIYYGEEIGMLGGTDPANRAPMPSWAFNKTSRDAVTTASGFLANPSKTYDYIAKLASIRKYNPVLVSGTYKEMWTQGSPTDPNVLAYLRSDGTNKVFVGLNNGTLESGKMQIPVISGIGSVDDGTILDDQLGGDPTVVTDQKWQVNIPALTAKIVKPRIADSTNAVWNISVKADTVWGENVYIVGNIPELGNWDTSKAVKLTTTAGTYPNWNLSLKYLKRGTSIEFKFIKINAMGVAWETRSNRTFSMPWAATANFAADWNI